MINKILAEERGISEKTQEIIQELQNDCDDLGKESLESTDEKKVELFNEWFVTHKVLQRLWEFPQDDNYIKFWEFPACDCPKLDNEDAYPTGYYTYSGNCVIHGKDL